MTKSFGDTITENIWKGRMQKNLPIDIQKIGRRKLRMINNANTVGDLRIPPENRLELLKGNLNGYHSIRINIQWRIVFQWENGDAYNVQIKDYH